MLLEYGGQEYYPMYTASRLRKVFTILLQGGWSSLWRLFSSQLKGLLCPIWEETRA